LKREYLGQLELMVLLAVIRPAKDAYGVLISHEIAQKSGREVAQARDAHETLLRLADGLSPLMGEAV
jgi:hypothetical protein